MTRRLRLTPTLDCVESTERGDTLIEVLVAVVIIGLTVVALLGTLLTTTTASVAHRATASFDAYVSNFAEVARNQIQLQANGASSGPTFTPCIAGGPAVAYKLVGNPIPHTGPVGASVALLGSGFLPTSATIVSSSGTSTNVGSFSTTPTSSSNGFIAQFKIPSVPTSAAYTIVLKSGANSYSAASEFDVTGATSPPYTTPTFSNSYDTFGVTLSFWSNGAWTTDQANCTPGNYDPNIQQLKIGLAHAQPNNGADSLETIVLSNFSPQGLSAPPASLSASTPAATAGTIRLSWFPPTFQGASGVASYNVYRSTTAGSQGSKITSVGPCASPSPCQYTDNNGGGGLADGTLYYYEVTAVNTIGESAASTQVTGTTLPGAPSGLTSTRGNTQVTLNWSAPSPAENAPITSYNIYRNTINSKPAAASASLNSSSCAPGCTFTNTGLTNGTTYYYWVTAMNGGGEGAAAGPTSVIPGSPPTAPLNLAVATTNTSGQLNLTWAPPTSNGGFAVNSYNVYRNTINSQPAAPFTSVNASTCTPNCTFTDSGRTNGTTYYYWVAAVNVVGEGPADGPVSIEAGLPGAPSGLSVTSHGKVGSNGFVNLSWTAPSVNGGSAVTSYNVYVSTTAGTQGSLAGSVTFSGTTAHVTGLNTNTTYYFEVTAVNSVGEGPPSNQTNPGVKP